MAPQRPFTLLAVLFLTMFCISLLTTPAAAQDIPDTFTVTVETETGQTLSVTIGVTKTENGYRLTPLSVYNPETLTFHWFFITLPDTVPHSGFWGSLFVDEETLLNILLGDITLGGTLGPSHGVDPMDGGDDHFEDQRQNMKGLL